MQATKSSPKLAGALPVGHAEGDLVARLGGDEFAAILEPVDGIEDALLSARRIADLIEQPFDLGDLRVPIRVSVGAALLTPDVGLSLRRADDELYRDKPRRGTRKRRAGLDSIASAA